jgi:hypothetical protein
MDVSDYLIEHEQIDWPSILAGWAWLLPAEFTVWLMNRYGDLFLVFEDDSVHLMDVANGSLDRLADNRDDFCQRIDQGNNANDWLMIPLVDRLVAAEKDLAPGRCYSFVIPPILGGDYTVGNTATLGVAEHFEVYAAIHKQLRDLPDGTKVRLVVKA